MTIAWPLLKELHSEALRCVCSNIVTCTSSSINSENKSGTTRSIHWRRPEFPGNGAAVLVTVSHEEQLVWPTLAINLSISPAGIRFITMQQGETLYCTEHQAQLHAPPHNSTKLTLFPLSSQSLLMRPLTQTRTCHKKKTRTVIDYGLWQDKYLWSSFSSQNSSHTVDKPDNMTIFRMLRKIRSFKISPSTQPLDMCHCKLDLFLSWRNKLQLLFVFSLWRNSSGPSKDKGRRSTQLKQQNPL